LEVTRGPAENAEPVRRGHDHEAESPIAPHRTGMVVASLLRLSTIPSKFRVPFRAIGVAGLGLVCSIATPTLAQTDTAKSQSQTLDAARGPITGSTRRIGLAGAFVAIADDTEGIAINPASTAVRLPYSFQDWNSGFGLDVAVGAWLPKNDVYNQGNTTNQDQTKADKSTALFGSLALQLNYRHFGVGVSAEAQRNAASRAQQTPGIDTHFAANFGTVHLNAAYGYLDGQLLLGAGARVIGMSFDRTSSSGVLGTAGVGYEAGVLLKPTGQHYRIAVALKSPIDAKLSSDPGAAASTVHVPWEVAFGLAYQLGPRPFNPRLVTAREVARRTTGHEHPTDAELEHAAQELFDRYEERQRWYLLVSSELSVIQGGGPVGLSGQTAMNRPVISPRVGLESEVVPHYLRLRTGSYYEPALIAGTQGRIHAAGGLDVKLFRWSVFGLFAPFDYWQLSLGADGARAYLNTAFSIGIWH
jgi:hypothetical protein